jgi:hypothetical protein
MFQPLSLQCGDFGVEFMWSSVPAMKICAFCMELPRYQFIRVRDAIAEYKLKKKDLDRTPKLKCMNNGYIQTHSV